MGYVLGYFDVHVRNWLNNQWLPRDGKIIEFGAQDFYGDADEIAKEIRQFLRDFRVEQEKIDGIGAPVRPF